MNFLAVNGFDFSKLYTSGITFERMSMRETILAAWKHAKKDKDGRLVREMKKQKILSKENFKRKTKILEEVEKMVYGGQTKLSYEIKSQLLKKELADVIRRKYPGMIAKYNENSLEIIKNENFTPPSKTVTSIQYSILSNEEEKTGSSDEHSSYSMDSLQKQNSAEVMENYRSDMGFTLVIEEMANSKKPIVGHN